MSRQRDAELALDGIIGATSLRQVLVPAFEATLVVGTAALLGLLMAATSTGVLAYGVGLIGSPGVFAMPNGLMLVTLLVVWLVTVPATVLPSLRSLHRPAPEVVAALVSS